jgi:hypothetical protein
MLKVLSLTCEGRRLWCGQVNSRTLHFYGLCTTSLVLIHRNPVDGGSRVTDISYML